MYRLGLWRQSLSRGIVQVRSDFAMSTAKAEVQAILDRLPDDVSLEDIQYQIYVRQKIERGLKDGEEGRTVSHEEAKRRLQKWLQK
jgi:predicted transcriptional regulator